MPEVALYLDVDQGLFHTSYVYTGLFQLAQQGRISLRVSHPLPGTWQKVAPGNVCVPVEVSQPDSGRSVPICFDLHDASDVFYPGPLNACAVYFKRSYFQPDVDALPAVLRSKVLPFGFNYPCSHFRSYPPLLSSAVRAVVQAARHSLPYRAQLRSLVRRVRDYMRLPGPSDLEYDPAAPKQAVIVFQPRLWEQHEVSGECTATINEQRVAVVRALKHEFGERFGGGLVPTPLARREHPDLLAPTPSRAYLQLTHRSLIGVYTRGLHHSTGWKLGEYLAASMCVVAEPLRNQPFAPLEPRRHLLWFASPEECVQVCATILQDRELQQEMRAAAHRYYLQHVEPAAHLLQCLERVQRVET